MTIDKHWKNVEFFDNKSYQRIEWSDKNGRSTFNALFIMPKQNNKLEKKKQNVSSELIGGAMNSMELLNFIWIMSPLQLSEIAFKPIRCVLDCGGVENSNRFFHYRVFLINISKTFKDNWNWCESLHELYAMFEWCI